MDAIGKSGLAQTALTRAAQPAAVEDSAADKAARDFEAVFLTQVVEEMMRTVDLGQFGGGTAEETWRGFLARAYAEQIANGEGTGIAGSVRSTIPAYGAAVRDGGDK